MQDAVVNTMTALANGDIDAYVCGSDFGVDIDSVRLLLLRKMVSRHVVEIARHGGITSVEPTHCQLLNDSNAQVSFILRYSNGSRESKIADMILKDGEWKMCVTALPQPLVVSSLQ